MPASPGRFTSSGTSSTQTATDPEQVTVVVPESNSGDRQGYCTGDGPNRRFVDMGPAHPDGNGDGPDGLPRPHKP